MAQLSLQEEIVNKYSTEDILLWAETELKTLKQISLSKDYDKAFLLGRVCSSMGDIASVLEALRKKLNPASKDEAPVVAG